MMIHPPLDELIKYAGNRYTLVTVAAKRARQIIEKDNIEEESFDQAVQIALEEIISGKTKFESIKAGIK
jgi:DNA-directed RNA polymerase, omega subunit